VSDHGPELVYAVPRDVLFDGADPWLGVKKEDTGTILDRTGLGSFVPRPEAEVDASLKQIIPYLVLRDGDLVFLMKRTRAGGDPRLHDRYTIGVGGHLNPGDVSILGGLRREWMEEMTAGFVPDFRYVGLLNDDTVEVGRHHLGIVFLADASGRRVGIRETHKLSGSFETVEAARAVHDLMETWSQLTLDAVEAATHPAQADAEAAFLVASRTLPLVNSE
jgi:predicted NUDIX family phosphoesterase